MVVSTAELAGHLNDPEWVVFDCRHDLVDLERGARLYREGHLPGAVFAPVDTALSGRKTGANGRHPLPEPQAFADFLARHGVGNETTVVAYDDAGGLYAARLWWMARWIGLRRAAVLDGGIGRWVSEGRPVTKETPPARTATELVARPEPAMVWSAAEVQAQLGSCETLVIDARAPERYRGEVEPIDRVAGHIPGAANRPFKANLNADLTLRPAGELRAEFVELLGEVKPENAVHQCGSGITACANLLAMERAGLGGSKLFAGSWSEWIADPARPIATGEKA